MSDTGVSSMRETVGVVIPAYNPDVTVLSSYISTIDRRLDPETIRVELDCPEPETVRALGSVSATVVMSDRRRGKGAALTAGFDALETDVLAFADADGSTPVGELARIVETVTSGAADLAVGSRRHPDATVESTQSAERAMLGDGFAWLARRILDIELYDYQCGAKAITAEGWQDVRDCISEDGFAWDIELIGFADAVGLQIAEIPITWHDHPDSTVSPTRTAIQLATTLGCTRHRTRRLKQESGLSSPGVSTASAGGHDEYHEHD